MDLEALVRPVVEGDGLELVDVTFHREGGRRVLRVTVDREGGVDLDAIAHASERISRRLDLEELTEGSYALEVSSPGLERPLKRPADFLRYVGETVRVRTARPIDGSKTHVGTLIRATDDGIALATASGERDLSYEAIMSARTVFEWGKP
ncbi:MAG: ribosome maturation factor RimP [Actinomycetota bacterium]